MAEYLAYSIFNKNTNTITHVKSNIKPSNLDKFKLTLNDIEITGNDVSLILNTETLKQLYIK